MSVTPPETALTIADPQAHLAQEVLRLAREQDIPIRQDAALAGALVTLDIGRSLPPELFRAVAQVLAFISKVDGK